ncbi:MAG: CARDB domain-containing protein, partial [Chloroflexota bacterium]|nr:CARDB domain-containing protein [Chloroflexota bacterium]
MDYTGEHILSSSNDPYVTNGRRLHFDDKDITPCVSDPRIAEPHCLVRGVPAALSGDGKYAFFSSDAPWDCIPGLDEYSQWVWQCAFDPGPTNSVVWRISTATGSLEQWTGILPTDFVWPLRPDFSGSLLVFIDIDAYPQDIYASRGGGNHTKIASEFTGSATELYNTHLSADGKWIAYGINLWYEPSDLHIMRSDGSENTIIHTFPLYTSGHHVRGISEDGSRILFDDHGSSTAYGDSHGWLINRDGSNLTPVLSNTDWESWHLSLSYNGQNVAFVSNEDILGNGNIHDQVFVLKGPAVPDLSVDAFTLDPAAITHSGDKYTLPLDITVRNTGQATATDFQVRFSDNGGWSETRTIATLNPDASTVLHLDWDITAQLDRGNGQSTVELVVTADPDNVIFENAEVNNTASASTDVDARPRILQIQPQFRLDSAYFLNNQSVNNPIKALVDWNGDLTGNGDPPYGDVYFDLNGNQSQESGQQWGAQHTYDMGSDFQSSFSCANNTLRVWAVGDFESLETTIQPTVFPFPGWVDWLGSLHLGEFSTEEQAPLVEYTYAFKYPEEPFEATWTPPGWIPYLGGHELGILETQSEANAAGKSDGAGSVGVSGQTGLGLGALNVDGNLSGRGDARFTCGESLDLTAAELNFGIHATIEQEAGLADVVPAVRAAEDWPVVGRAIRWVNESAQVKASLTPGIDIATQFEARDDELQFVNGEGTGSIDVRVELSTEPCQDLSASVYGGGTPSVTIQVPQNPGYLKEVGIDLYYGATFQAWEFETEYERQVNCHYPDGCSEVEGSGMTAMADGADWHLIPRNYAASGPMLRAAAATTETVLVSPAYARPEPALAARADGFRLLTYIHDDDAKPHGRGTEIRTLAWDGSWGSPVSLTDDQQPDFAPAVAFDGNGDGLVVWERSTLATDITPTLDITFAQSLEIVARAWVSSTAAWGNV